MSPAKRRIDYTFAWTKPNEVDLDELKPKAPRVYREWRLVSYDGAERCHIWAHHDEYGWHGWPIYNGEPNKTMLFTTYPTPGWKEDTGHA